MPRKLNELRMCDNCSGPVGMIFYVLRVSLAVVNVQAVHETLGMHQFFGGRASAALVENFAPSASHGFTIAMDEDESKELGTEAFVCQKCMMEPTDLPMLIERISERRKKTERDANTDAV